MMSQGRKQSVHGQRLLLYSTELLIAALLHPYQYPVTAGVCSPAPSVIFLQCLLSTRSPSSRSQHTILLTAACHQAQKEALDSRIRALSNSHLVHPGLQHFIEGRPGPLAVFDIPGVREAGWAPENAPQPRSVRVS